eukprot:gene32076-39621_t
MSGYRLSLWLSRDRGLLPRKARKGKGRPKAIKTSDSNELSSSTQSTTSDSATDGAASDSSYSSPQPTKRTDQTHIRSSRRSVSDLNDQLSEWRQEYEAPTPKTPFIAHKNAKDLSRNLSERRGAMFALEKNTVMDIEGGINYVPADLKRVDKHRKFWEDRMEVLCDDYGPFLIHHPELHHVPELSTLNRAELLRLTRDSMDALKTQSRVVTEKSRNGPTLSLAFVKLYERVILGLLYLFSVGTYDLESEAEHETELQTNIDLVQSLSDELRGVVEMMGYTEPARSLDTHLWNFEEHFLGERLQEIEGHFDSCLETRKQQAIAVCSGGHITPKAVQSKVSVSADGNLHFTDVDEEEDEGSDDVFPWSFDQSELSKEKQQHLDEAPDCSDEMFALKQAMDALTHAQLAVASDGNDKPVEAPKLRHTRSKSTQIAESQISASKQLQLSESTHNYLLVFSELKQCARRASRYDAQRDSEERLASCALFTAWFALTPPYKQCEVLDFWAILEEEASLDAMGSDTHVDNSNSNNTHSMRNNSNSNKEKDHKHNDCKIGGCASNSKGSEAQRVMCNAEITSSVATTEEVPRRSGRNKAA